MDIPLSRYHQGETPTSIYTSFVSPTGIRVYAGFAGFSDRWTFQLTTDELLICEATTTAAGTTNFCDVPFLRSVVGRTKANVETFNAHLMAPFVRDSRTISGVRDLYDRTFAANEPRVRLVCVFACERLWEGFNASWNTLTGELCNALGNLCDKGLRDLLEIPSLTDCSRECDSCLTAWIRFCRNPNYRGPGGQPEPARHCFDYAAGCMNGSVVLKNGHVLVD